ncbi:MAG: hypothetical protein ACYCXW_24225 [Solirubrobacteraceae bacterium]
MRSLRGVRHWGGRFAVGAAVAAAAIAPWTSSALAGPARAASAASAAATALPTLGVRGSLPVGSGFGQVKPRTVSYEGDPTSFVVKVRWSSWGGPRAVGHGMSDWVWPGWCVACGSVPLRATVVAFGRTVCQGHSAYSHVEWYFPSRGMSFSPRLGNGNICHMGSGPVGPTSKLKNCGSVPLTASGSVIAHAGSITTYGSPISCATVRRFVATSGAGRYLHRNARFTVQGWWCGSELSMSLGGPQSFTCDRGDFANVTFNLKR